MKITRLEDMDKSKVEMEGARNVCKQVPISKVDGSPLVSFRVFTIEPDGHTPFHQHEWEHLNYIIEGEGAIVMENEKEQKIQKGDFILVLPNEKHRYRNTSTGKALVMICAVPKQYE